MKTSRSLITLASTILLLAATANTQAQLTVLHTFAGPPSDGSLPAFGSLAQNGSTLYGMTESGGASDSGMVFRVNTDGSGFTTLHSFGSLRYDGSDPIGSLLLDGSTLYGMTYQGGSNSVGTVFKINTDGSGYAILHSFAGGASDGGGPVGSLISADSTLYGMTSYGGSHDFGTIFQISTNGTGYSVLHSFVGGADDGAIPEGDLALFNSVLYGLTEWAGTSGSGVVFRVHTDGNYFEVIHSFVGGEGDGLQPYGSLTTDGFTLYGTTGWGGSSNNGTVFSILPDGSGFSLLHSFAGHPNDGSAPFGNVTMVGSNLYGMSYLGGRSDYGTVFRANLDGSGYTNLYSFVGFPTEGANPLSSFTLVNSNLYAMTQHGGAHDAGVIFSFTPSGSVIAKQLQAMLNLNPAKTNADTCRLTAIIRAESGFSLSNQTVLVNVGDAQASFTLNAKGCSATKTNACKLTYAKKTQLWTLTASIQKGSWAAAWGEYGVTNATTPKAGTRITLPVRVTIGNETFATEKSLLYKATVNKSGTLR
ncbi:MAG TPA: choice-of-anchor tandem repeat GloVer-containing protein [Verrucomicrobiae bacterium]|nr:choice-of-anchor tandem repeat GloVer-containing protein [Verrucomicrobiae bacterium]